VALKRFLANERDKAVARKRGGGQVHVALDALTAEQRYALEPVGALVFRRALLLRLFGLAVLDRAGQPATRWRLLWRRLLTWGLVGMIAFFAAGSVALLVAADFASATEREGLLAFGTPKAWICGLSFTGIMLAATIYTVTHPSRSLQDCLAGTWLVPR
jgi:hypothetical protein